MTRWLRDHFTLNAWTDYDFAGLFSLIRLDTDWCGFLYRAVSFSLLGLHVSVTYWPGGKFTGALFRAGVPVESLGREHGP